MALVELSEGLHLCLKKTKIMEIKDNKLIIDIPKGMEVDIENTDLTKGIVKFKQSTLKPKIELKPFDKVLVRDCLDEMWRPSFFACYLPFGREPYQVISGEWVKLCIPYEGNESLLGTTKDVEG